MKTKFLIVTMTALALTSACSRGGTANNAVGNNSAANAAAATNAAGAEEEGNAAAPAGNSSAGAASTGPVDVAFLTGRWGMNGDCSSAMEFRADGTATPPEGSTYAIEGNVVTVTSPGQPPDPRTVTRTGDDAMTVSGGGQSMNLTRCH